MKKIVVIGAGGNSKVILDIILERIRAFGEELQIVGILDDDETKKTFLGFSIIGPIDSIPAFREDRDIHFVNGIGDNRKRKQIYEKFTNDHYYTTIHPSAILGSGVRIGDGCVIMPGVIINADSKIGTHTLVNTGTIIEHDNVIGAFSHLASGTVTPGNVHIGRCTMLGTGTKVIQGISIGNNALIGAGSVVVKDIPDNCTAVGVPAKVIKYRKEE